MKDKIIIDNRSSHNMETALIYAQQVLRGGRDDHGRYSDTFWPDGTVVYAEKNKTGDKFTVFKNHPKG